MKQALALILAFVVSTLTLQAGAPSFIKDDTILFYGNSMVERLLEHGEMEALVQLAHSEKQLHLRSLAWTGDEVGYRLRPEGYAEHLKALIDKWPAKVVVLGYGMNESFAGAAGLSEFKAQLYGHLDQLSRLHPGAKQVLLSPITVEGGTAHRNADVAAYAKAIGEIAQQRGAVFVDLFAATTAAYSKDHAPLTVNGIHLNDDGLHRVAPIIAEAIAGPATKIQDAVRVAEVAKAAAQKHYYNAQVVRPKNADLYYGVRKRPDEYAAEIPRYYQMIDLCDAVVHQNAETPGQTFASHPAPSLPPMPEGKGHDDGNRTGVIKPPAEQMVEFKVADGFSVNLFASEEQFPELKNPVQCAFDARGRLWVVTMPSFPHTVPGLKQDDRIVILEDTDHDGKADKNTTFAGGMDALDGFVFHHEGVIVSEQPRLIYMNDTNGDSVADTKRELLRGIDVTDSHHGGMIATDPMGGVMFCDGVFHRSQIETPFGVLRAIDATTYRLNTNTGRVETEWQSTTPNPWKITFDRFGNTFQMYGDGLVLDGLALTWTPLGVYHPFAYAKTLGYGKGSAAQSISSPNFPDEYRGGMASAALLGSYTVSLTKYSFDKGLVQGSDRLDVLSSPNAAFRPADLAFGFDGALYVSDFCSAIIGHAQHPMRDPHWDHTHGRIWRVVYNKKPLVKDWPKIEGAGAEELCALLMHPQDIVRHHARIELRKLGSPALAKLDAWITAQDRVSVGFDQAALETLFVLEGVQQTRPALLAELLKSKSALHRAAAVHLIRVQADRLGDATALLKSMAIDPHPRVLMEVVGAVAHLRPTMPQVEQAIVGLKSENVTVNQMLSDLKYGTQPLKGRSVPVLEIAKETQLRGWQWLGEKGDATPETIDEKVRGKGDVKSGLYRTFVQADAPRSAVLSVKHGYLDISVNAVQSLSQDSMWSSDQQVQVELQKGLNVIEIIFRRLKNSLPTVYLYDPLGQPVAGVMLANDEASLAAFAAADTKANAQLGNVLRIQAVPNQMQFSPKELRVKAGARVRLIFNNPDLMMHNLVIAEPDSAEEIGALSDRLATQPDGLAKGYVPDTKKILHATKLISPNTKAELSFDAPTKPGSYPFLCTFPGHWRIMRGVMIVEPQ